jgi:hypothetical protein
VAIALETECRMTVLGERSDASVLCSPVKLVGGRLIVMLADRVEPDAAIRFDAADSLILGEIAGCWEDDGAIYAAIALRNCLNGVSTLLVDARWPNESPDAIRYPAGRAAFRSPESARRYGWMIP